MITLKNAYKVYTMGDEKIYALDDVTLNIPDKEFVSIVGPSGSGKSTLMHVLGGLDKLDKGTIQVNELNLSKASKRKLAKFRNKEIGFVFQSFNLQPTMSALDNVMLPLIFGRIRGSERKRRALEALEHVGLTDRLYHKPSEMSGGQRQRVSIARALVNKPSIILADEPTGNLDSKTGKKIIEVLDTLNEDEGITIVVVTHDSGIANAGDRIITLRDGKIIKDKKGAGKAKRSKFISDSKVET
jgi:putative ABC transport system ATP-binding protein